MPQCVTCGCELHPERPLKYNYCMARECQDKNAKGLTTVAVGVNKAAEQVPGDPDHPRLQEPGEAVSKPMPGRVALAAEGGRPHLRAGHLLAAQSLLPFLS
jgi:hypothetical protein